MDSVENIDLQEAKKFDQMAAQWWDPEGECRALHDINAPRMQFIAERVALSKATVLDIGCGGGLLSEAMAKAGAEVTGIDVAKRALDVAKMHAQAGGLSIDYQQKPAETLATERPDSFDVVCCLEALEHVPRPADVVEAAAALCRPGGSLFFSTINRTPLAWAGAIVGAEQILGLLPKGTHHYDRLIKPSELAQWCRNAGLEVVAVTGLAYNPFSRTVKIGGPPRINYFVHAAKPNW